MRTVVDIAREGRAQLAECLRILGPLPPVPPRPRGGARAWDAAIVHAIKSEGCPVEARRAWRHATDLWWELALTETLDLVRWEANKHLNAGRGRYRLEDLVSAGFEGCYRAAQRWTPGGGMSWRNFAAIGIRMLVRQGFRTGATDLVRINERVRWAAIEIRKWMRELEIRGQEPTLAEAARLAGVDQRTLDRITASASVIYLDHARRSDGVDRDRSWHEVVAAEEEDPGEMLDRQREIDALQAAVDQLPERQRIVIEGRMAEQSFAEIGERLGLSRERCRQIETQAMHAIARTLGRVRDVAQKPGKRWRETPSRAVTRCLIAAGVPVELDQLAEATGLKPEQVRSALGRIGVAHPRGTSGRVVYTLRDPGPPGSPSDPDLVAP